MGSEPDPVNFNPGSATLPTAAAGVVVTVSLKSGRGLPNTVKLSSDIYTTIKVKTTSPCEKRSSLGRVLQRVGGRGGGFLEIWAGLRLCGGGVLPALP